MQNEEEKKAYTVWKELAGLTSCQYKNDDTGHYVPEDKNMKPG